MAKNEIVRVDATDKVQLKKDFKGYTIEELRYKRALTAMRKEFCKANMRQSIAGLKNPFGTSKVAKALPMMGQMAMYVPEIAGVRKPAGVGRTLLRTLVGKISPLDYVMWGISLIGPARKMVKKLKKKKS